MPQHDNAVHCHKPSFSLYGRIWNWTNHRRVLRLHACVLCFGLFKFVLAVTGQGTVPPSPDKPWLAPDLGNYERELASTNFFAEPRVIPIRIDPKEIYDLPDLIDLAERSHPQTRKAWEQARSQAKAVGLSESAYYPYLVASASAGGQRGLSVLTSVFPANVFEEDAGLNLSWLLFDFGERKAKVAEAKAKLTAANVNFNATHQQIVFAVTQSFYQFNIARQQVKVTESSLQAAETVMEAATTRLDNGLATKPQVLQAAQKAAQANYNLVAARGAVSDAQVALVRNLGIFPTLNIQVAEIPERRIVENLDESLDALILRALSQRPELVAKLAGLKASQWELNAARAEYYPKISLDASAGWLKLDVSADGSPYFGNSKPVYGAGFTVTLPIFDGFLRRNRLQIAASNARAAGSELTDARDASAQQVWQAYVDLKTALRKQDAAEALLSSAESAFDASLDSYKNGLGTYVDLVNAQQDLASARNTVVDTRAAILISRTSLALSVGDLAKPLPRSQTIHH
jgi:outer membrane protein